MSETWEIDPTNPDGESAGAKGGAVGGDSAGDTTLPSPLRPPQDVDRTNPLEPTGGTSTPYPPPDDGGETIELGNINPNENDHDDEVIDDNEFDDDDLTNLLKCFGEEQQTSWVDKTINFIKAKYKKVDLHK